jgi:hypothetical protein
MASSATRAQSCKSRSSRGRLLIVSRPRAPINVPVSRNWRRSLSVADGCETRFCETNRP